MNPSKEHIDRLIKKKLANRDFGAPPEAFLKDLDKRMGNASKGWTRFFVFLNIVFIIILLLSKCGEALPVYVQKNLQLSTNQIQDTTDNWVPKKTNQIVTSHRERDNQKRNPKRKANGVLHKSHKTKRTTTNPTIPFVSQVKEQDHPQKSDIPTKNHSTVPQPVEKSKDLAFIPTDLAVIKENLDTPSFFAIPFDSRPHPKQTKKTKKSSQDSTVTKKDKEKKKPKKKSKISIELQLYGGISGNLIGLSGKSSTSYLNEMKKRIKNPINPNIGMRVNMIYKNWLFGTGFSYTTSREKNDYSTKSFTQYDSVYVSGTTIDSVYSVFDSITNQWDSVYVTSPTYDSVTVTHTIKNEHTIRQLYSWIQIPLRFGYRFKMGKWAIVPSIGANIAVGIKNNNLIYPTTDYKHLQEFSALRIHFNLMGNIEVRYQINQWHVFLGTGFQYAINPYLKTDKFTLKYNQINGVLGIGYQF